MPARLMIRAVLAAVCAAGVVACVLTYRSQSQLTDAFVASGKRDPHGALREARASDSALFPTADRDGLEAAALVDVGRPADAERVARASARRNSLDVRPWATLARVQVGRREIAAARVSWARARALDPALPAQLPPPIAAVFAPRVTQ